MVITPQGRRIQPPGSGVQLGSGTPPSCLPSQILLPEPGIQGVTPQSEMHDVEASGKASASGGHQVRTCFRVT